MGLERVAPEDVARRPRDGHDDPARRRGHARRASGGTSASARRSSTGATRSPRSKAPSTRSCSRATRSARSRSRGPAPAGSRRRRRWSPTWSRSSARPEPASSRTTPAGASSTACRRATCRSPFYVRVEVADQPGVLALVALRLAAQGVSVARLVQQQGDGSATLHIVTHEAPAGRLVDALAEIDGLRRRAGRHPRCR